MPTDAYDRAREAYEAADDARHALAANPRTVGIYHAHMAPLAAACRDAASTEQDRCRWDSRCLGHQAGSRERAAPVKAARTAPAQLRLF